MFFKNVSIFKQLVFLVIIPVVVSLIGLAIYNINHTRETLVGGMQEKSQILSDEIHDKLEFQDYALSVIEKDMDTRMKYLSNEIIEKYVIGSDSVEGINLKELQIELEMDPDHEDIYLINKDGVIVNSTLKSDLGLNLFALGDELEAYLLHILVDGKFKADAFSIESSTKRLKKYCYQPTNDGEYILELGFYNKDAEKLDRLVQKRINEISKKHESVKSVDLFIGSDNPVSFNSENTIHEDHYNTFVKAIKNQSAYFIDEDHMQYGFIYMDRNSDIFGDSVIRIINDRTKEINIINQEVLIFSLIFAITIILLFMIILLSAKSITTPLNNLVKKINRISEGNLSERTDPDGCKEIRVLSTQFNYMLEELEELYNGLEKKVIQRTAEISQQKEEIESQRDQIEQQRDVLVENHKNLERAYHEIEDQQKKITDSIHYARRIQSAILPTRARLKELLHDHFVLYKPKDIVSGDFYWATKQGNKSLIVAADCTGHGVPGALMSMIGNTLLNKIIGVEGITHPDQILDQLRTEIIESLKQTGEDFKTKDGMDVVLCAIDHDNNKLEFAGANNPLFLVRDGELVVYKGDKQPVGYHIGEPKPFTNHVLDVQKGDRIYIFTDGYQDQFGGEKERKFLVKRFRNLLLEIHKEPMAEQKEILDTTIEEWMINTFQVDDILVLGFEI